MVSWPTSSTLRETRTPTVFPSASQTAHEVPKANTPTASTPRSCTPILPPAAIQTASVPQIPANKWAGIAPTTSSQLHVLQQPHAGQTQHPANRADDDCPIWLHNIRSGGNRNKAANRAVQNGKEVDPSE